MPSKKGRKHSQGKKIVEIFAQGQTTHIAQHICKQNMRLCCQLYVGKRREKSLLQNCRNIHINTITTIQSPCPLNQITQVLALKICNSNY